MTCLKFSVVGCGNIGSRHLAVIKNQAQAKLTAICDVDIAKCKKYGELYGVPYFLDLSEMLKKADIDIVNICTPHGWHAAMAIEAANSGKNVLVEKPMALTTKEANKMIEAAEQNKVYLMVVKQNRYNIPVVMAKKALDEQKLGKIYMAQCNIFWNRHEQYYRNSDWRGKRGLEGGALYTQVSHFIDLMIWWFGDVTEATAYIATKKHDIQIEDCGTANLVFKSGTIATLTWTTCVYDRNYEGSITLIGENGTIKIGGQYLNKIEFWDVRSFPLSEDIRVVDRPNSYGNYQGTSSNHDKVINDVIQDLLFGRQKAVRGDEGIKTIRAIEMIYSSARTVNS